MESIIDAATIEPIIAAADNPPPLTLRLSYSKRCPIWEPNLLITPSISDSALANTNTATLLARYRLPIP
jgi:hypothetical protein